MVLHYYKLQSSEEEETINHDQSQQTLRIISSFFKIDWQPYVQFKKVGTELIPKLLKVKH